MQKLTMESYLKIAVCSMKEQPAIKENPSAAETDMKLSLLCLGYQENSLQSPSHSDCSQKSQFLIPELEFCYRKQNKTWNEKI